MSEAPAIPCKRRNSTISGRLVAMPHRTEVRVKPPMEIRNSFLRPIFIDSQPDSGVMIAEAMM